MIKELELLGYSHFSWAKMPTLFPYFIDDFLLDLPLLEYLAGSNAHIADKYKKGWSRLVRQGDDIVRIRLDLRRALHGGFCLADLALQYSD
jgi:hypothetical protein